MDNHVKTHKTVGFLLNRVDCNDGIASHCETLIRGLKNSGWKVVLITGKVNFDDSSVKRFESLKALSKGGSEEAFLMQTRLRALENARAGQTVPKPDDMTIVFHSGTCQCNAVRFQVSVTTGGDMIPILPIP